MRAGEGARTGLAVAVASSAAFSTSGALAASLIGSGWSPAAAVTVRVSVAAVVLAIPAVMSLRGRWHTIRRARMMIIAYGLLAVTCAQLCYFSAIQHLPVGVALMIEYTATILVVGWMWIRHRQRPRALTLWGSAAALAGLALVLGVVSAARLDLVGVAWALGAAVGLASFFILASDSSDVPPVALASFGMGVGAVALLVIGFAGILPLHATFGSVILVRHRVSWLIPVVGLALVAAVIAYMLGIVAARLLGAKLASFVGLTEVIFAVLIAWLLLGQLPTALQLAGGALILAGITLVRIDELRATPPGRAVDERDRQHHIGVEAPAEVPDVEQELYDEQSEDRDGRVELGCSPGDRQLGQFDGREAADHQLGEQCDEDDQREHAREAGLRLQGGVVKADAGNRGVPEAEAGKADVVPGEGDDPDQQQDPGDAGDLLTAAELR
jgi:drug/metabolite transporter (DMT)-like permease